MWSVRAWWGMLLEGEFYIFAPLFFGTLSFALLYLVTSFLPYITLELYYLKFI
jgi:hypothetical protein